VRSAQNACLFDFAVSTLRYFAEREILGCHTAELRGYTGSISFIRTLPHSFSFRSRLSFFLAHPEAWFSFLLPFSLHRDVAPGGFSAVHHRLCHPAACFQEHRQFWCGRECDGVGLGCWARVLGWLSCPSGPNCLPNWIALTV
jgi:hypothetical protein